MKTIIVLVVIGCVFAGMEIIRLLIRQLVKRYSGWKKLADLMPLAGLIIWLVVLFWLVNYLFKYKSYYNIIVTSIIVILSLATAWFFFKDLIAGIFFRTLNNYSQGEFVQFGKISGRFNEMHLTHISMHTEDGRSIKIPYSRLSNKIISLKPETRSFENNRVVIHINKIYPKDETETTMYNLLNSSPWRIGTLMPQVKFVGEDNDHYSYEIQVKTRNQSHLDHIKNNLQGRFEHL